MATAVATEVSRPFIPRQKQSKKLLRMLDAYEKVTNGDEQEAARIAGYKWPEKVAYAIKKRYWKAFEDADDRRVNAAIMSSRELEERIVMLARNPAHRDHFKALELLAKIHGKLDPKVTVQLERGSLATQIDDLLVSMTAARALLGAGVNTVDVVASEPPTEPQS